MLSYAKKHLQAEWTYYQLTPNMLQKNVKRSNHFRKDRLLKIKQANVHDYQKSGYDRGHLVPARDMSFSKEAMRESFYLSNIAPQTPNFNRGIWKKLETYVRKKVVKNQKLHIFSGGILKGCQKFIGKNKITVPLEFYKIIYNEQTQKMIAFIIPNEKGTKNLEGYIVSVDSIENITGIDFFPQLTDDLENRLEKQPQKHIDLF